MSLNNSTRNQSLPYVTVIVPVLNAPKRVGYCIEALLKQTYPKERYEILVIDNGSTDHTPQIVKKYPVKLLVENNVQSPYAARNLGVKRAQGEIIAMIDANCIPGRKWLEKGIHVLEQESVDLIGGKVTFTFSPEKTIAEMFDSIGNVEIKRNIATRGVAKGGNLFVRKCVFEKIGLFPAHIRSGGDVLWTGRATRAGFKLVYASDAEVFYPSRKLIPLLKKQYRIGRGQPVVWQDQGQSFVNLIKRIVFGFRPPSLRGVKNLIHERGTDDMQPKLFAIWFISWLCAIVTNLGRIHYLLGRLFSTKE